MIETGVVIVAGAKEHHELQQTAIPDTRDLWDKMQQTAIWHEPPGRTGGSIPDTRDLWDILWENRQLVVGFAHSHPGLGIPQPSYTDLTTFYAVETGLGRPIAWWITSADTLVECVGPDLCDPVVVEDTWWVDHLRRISGLIPKPR